MAWDRVRGHEALVEGFRRVVRRGRLAHAYLFTGPPGVGKRRFAVELAKALLCEAGTGELRACDHCHSCVMVEAGTHPDFFAFSRPEGSNELPIELMRELCRGFTLKSALGRGKVAVLDDADDLNEASANCFLKTLEEPPPRSVFILVGTGSERQLPTIVSRCQVVRFAGLPGPLVAEILASHEITDPRQQERLVRLAGGSPGVALTLADPGNRAPVVETQDDLGAHLDAAAVAANQPHQIDLILVVGERHKVDDRDAAVFGLEAGLQDTGLAAVAT